MYRFFKGEEKNCFDNEDSGASAIFWKAESVFNDEFKQETSYLYVFFKDHDMSDRFMKLLAKEDNDYLTEKSKKPVFELWFEYLFKYKYYGEYGDENKLKKFYHSIDP